MTDIETRLRADLPALADHLLADPTTDDPATDGGRDDRHRPAPPEPPRPIEFDFDDDEPIPRRRWPALSAAAIIAVVGLGAATVVLTDDGDVAAPTSSADADAATAVDPGRYGSWSSLVDAPIEPRAFAASAWIDGRAVFWAGSSLDRGFAYTDGAAYDPATGTWAEINTPGWGHPGLTASSLGDTLYVLAKGGGSRYDAADEEWADLPPVEGMFLAATVATDDALYGLGPVTTGLEGQPDLAIARYDASTDAWVDGPTFVGTNASTAVVDGLSRFETTVHWDGTEIIAWRDSVGGVAFDPDTETWRTIDPPEVPGGRGLEAVAVGTDAGLVLLQTVASSTRTIASLAVHDGEGWRRATAALPIADVSTATLAAAGEWVVIFTPEGPPLTVHVPSGNWLRDHDHPLAGVQAPNTVWTGDELVVWGGVGTAATRADGAIWTPPT